VKFDKNGNTQSCKIPLYINFSLYYTLRLVNKTVTEAVSVPYMIAGQQD